MADFKLIPFEPAHADILLKSGSNQELKHIGTDGIRMFSEYHAANGMCFTLTRNNRVIGCGGVDVKDDKGTAWLLYSFDIAKYAKTAMRVTKIALEGIIKENGLTSIQALIDAKDVAAQAFAHVMGFIYQPSTPKVYMADVGYLTYRRAA